MKIVLRSNVDGLGKRGEILEVADGTVKRLHYRARKKLAERDYASPAQLDAARTQERVSHAALRETRAALDQAQRDLARTEVRAPYTGRVRATSVDLLDPNLKILADEEEHVDYLETQFDLIEQIGIEQYIKLNSAPADDASYKDFA